MNSLIMSSSSAILVKSCEVQARSIETLMILFGMLGITETRRGVDDVIYLRVCAHSPWDRSAAATGWVVVHEPGQHSRRPEYRAESSSATATSSYREYGPSRTSYVGVVCGTEAKSCDVRFARKKCGLSVTCPPTKLPDMQLCQASSSRWAYQRCLTSWAEYHFYCAYCACQSEASQAPLYAGPGGAGY